MGLYTYTVQTLTGGAWTPGAPCFGRFGGGVGDYVRHLAQTLNLAADGSQRVAAWMGHHYDVPDYPPAATCGRDSQPEIAGEPQCSKHGPMVEAPGWSSCGTWHTCPHPGCYNAHLWPSPELDASLAEQRTAQSYERTGRSCRTRERLGIDSTWRPWPDVTA